MIQDYTDQYLNGTLELEFNYRNNSKIELETKIDRLEKRSKKVVNKSSENLKRWF